MITKEAEILAAAREILQNAKVETLSCDYAFFKNDHALNYLQRQFTADAQSHFGEDALADEIITEAVDA